MVPGRADSARASAVLCEGAAWRHLSLTQWFWVIALVVATSAIWAKDPSILGLILTIGASVAFLMSAFWKTLLVVLSVRTPPMPDPLAEWPRYTILAALYREAEIIDQLVERLARLDYPPDRLQ